MPSDQDAPVFDQPWQAKAFALTILLHERGIFSWAEWSETLGRACKDAAAARGVQSSNDEYRQDYHLAWLKALETLTTAKGLSTDNDLGDMAAAWHRAAEATPHGTPIRLENRPPAGQAGRDQSRT